MNDVLITGDGTRADIVFAHGAGAPMDHEFMEYFARGLAEMDCRIIRFEFPYMARRRRDGKKPGPDRPPVLMETFRNVLRSTRREGVPLVAAGKSMGGRIATMLAAERSGIDGCLALGYPFHPSGKPDRLRTAHLHDIMTPLLICQGERDPFGSREEVSGYDIGKAGLFWLPDGDHSFRPRMRSGFTETGNRALALEAIDRFLTENP